MSRKLESQSPLRCYREQIVTENGVGIRQQTAADRCGVSRQTWAAWETGFRPITLDQMSDIKRALCLNEEQVIKVFNWSETTRSEKRPGKKAIVSAA